MTHSNLFSRSRGAMLISIALAAAALAGCGGGGANDKIVQNYGQVQADVKGGDATVNAGNSVQLLGFANTSSTKMSTMSWSVTAPAGKPVAVTSNADCASAVKATTVPDGSDPQNPSTGASQWSCALSLTAPADATSDVAYNVNFVATDERGTVQTVNKTVQFLVSAIPHDSSLSVKAGPDFDVISGAAAVLHCDATGGIAPYSYQWVVAANGRLPLALSTFSGTDTDFTAPATASDTPVAFTCRATDAFGVVGTSTVNAVIKPSPQTGGNAAPTLVAALQNTNTVAPGELVSLDATGTGWYGGDGLRVDGPKLTYAWSSTDADILFSDVNALAPTFVVPTTVANVRRIPITLTVTGNGQTSVAKTYYTVDPYGPLTLSVTPAAASGAPAAYSFSAVVNYSGQARQVYYQWTQVSGPVMNEPIGGATTNTMGVAPTAVGKYVFRVAVGYEPISGTAPGVYLADVVLNITP